MSIEASQPLVIGHLVAGADLSALQYTFVKVNTSAQIVACNGATDRPLGVLQNKPTSGQAAVVCSIGVTKIQADAALDEGVLIGTSADGQADAKTPGTDTTEYIVGQVIGAASAAGGLISALINCASPARAA